MQNKEGKKSQKITFNENSDGSKGEAPFVAADSGLSSQGKHNVGKSFLFSAAWRQIGADYYQAKGTLWTVILWGSRGEITHTLSLSIILAHMCTHVHLLLCKAVSDRMTASNTIKTWMKLYAGLEGETEWREEKSLFHTSQLCIIYTQKELPGRQNMNINTFYFYHNSIHTVVF